MNCFMGNHAPVQSAAGRFTADFNENWRFMKLTKKNGLSELSFEEMHFDDQTWEEVSLPHTWNAIDGVGGSFKQDEGGESYYRGAGGYRKKAYFSGSIYAGKSIFIEFEGANTVAELYVNGSFAGRHEGGYSAFRFYITPFIRLDEENIFAVRVNNAPTDYIAPITAQGDFTKMGGIYRDVKIITVNPVHIDLMDFGSSGIFVTPQNISDDHADAAVLVRLANDGRKERDVNVIVNIQDQQGNMIAFAERKTTLLAGQKTQTEMMLSVEKPVLWNGTKNPCLYAAEILVEAGGQLLDRYVQSFGIRTYHIDPENGFFLNGKYLDLRGVNYHQDSFENGWAMTDEERERDYHMIREMGCTSVRMAHYQHDGYEYELCDRMGLTVWTEIGIVNRMSADEGSNPAVSERFAANAKQQLIELIRQTYNHPSVIVWGISNELYQMSDEIYDMYTALYALAKKEDQTRLITFADAQFWGKFLELPADVVGYNRYFGWYKEAGPAAQFGAWLDSFHKVKEVRPLCVSEYGAGAALSQFKDHIDWQTDIDPWGERHYQNYQSAMHEEIWVQLARRRYLWGKYVWCMFDCASAGRMEGDTVGQNDKGLATRERVPKDAFYFYKSIWNTAPMLHITEKGFAVRNSTVPQVKAYANADRAELFVNGVSCGSISRFQLDRNLTTVFIWKNVRLDENRENEIFVRAEFSDGTVLEDKAFWTGLKADEIDGVPEA